MVTRGLVGVKMGQVWLQLVRSNQVVEDNREEYFALAPHTMQRREVLVDLHPVVTRAKRGDLIRVMRNTGGGGGHQLTVKDFKMILLHKSPLQ